MNGLAREEIYDNEEAEEEKAVYESTILLDDETSRVLTHTAAGQCLHTLGRCDSGYGYAYLGLNASDKGLTDVSVISSFGHVLYVNVSGNKLTLDALRTLETMTYLLMLQADRNRLTSAELKPMPYLQVLTMNRNKLIDTCGIRHKSLECLELDYNNIRIVSLDPQILESLKTLNLRGNALISTRGINCPSLVRLFLAENKIEKIEGLETLVNLQTLHLRSNRLANLDGFHEGCRNLRYVNLRNNLIWRMLELQKLSYLPNLETLVIVENPFLEEEEEAEAEKKEEYRQIILATLPKLKRIDKDSVTEEERNKAAEFLGKMKKKMHGFAHVRD